MPWCRKRSRKFLQLKNYFLVRLGTVIIIPPARLSLPLPGFESIKRGWNSTCEAVAARLMHGEYNL